MAKRKTKCNVCNKADALSRGLCKRCYSNARHLIKLGETTDAELVRKGIWHARRTNEVREALERR